METKLNSYYGLAYNDYLYASNMLEVAGQIGNYNVVASLCAQSAEKYMKFIIEKYFIHDESSIELLRSHNLRSILNKIKELFKDCPLSSKDYKWLGDFYFDSRYPGDNFIHVNKEDGEECCRLVEELQLWVDSIKDIKPEDV